MERTQRVPIAEVSIIDVVRALEATMADEVAAAALSDSVVEVARGALATVDATVFHQCSRQVAVLGALTLASRRTGHVELEPAQVAPAVDADPDAVARAEATLASELSPPASADEVQSLRRTLIVANELRVAVTNDRLDGFELPGSYLADAAPELVSRVGRHHTRCDSLTDDGLTADELQAHIDRLEADLELARLGTELYVAVHGDDCSQKDGCGRADDCGDEWSHDDGRDHESNGDHATDWGHNGD